MCPRTISTWLACWASLWAVAGRAGEICIPSGTPITLSVKTGLVYVVGMDQADFVNQHDYDELRPYLYTREYDDFGEKIENPAPPPAIADYLKRKSFLSRVDARASNDKIPLLEFGVVPKINSRRVRYELDAALGGLSQEDIKTMSKADFSRLAGQVWDGMILSRAVAFRDKTGEVAWASVADAASSERRGLLRYSRPPPHDPGGFGQLRQIDRHVDQLLAGNEWGSSGGDNICGPVCLVNLAQRWAGESAKHPIESLREILALLPDVHVTVKRQLEKWLRVSELLDLAEIYLPTVGSPARVEPSGAPYGSSRPKSDIRPSAMLAAEKNPVLALIKINGFDPSDDYWTEERMLRSFYPGSGEFGHFILIEKGWRDRWGQLKVLVNDPLIRKNYTATLKPIRGDKMGYKSFRLIRPKAAQAETSQESEFVVITTALVVKKGKPAERR